MPNPPITPAHPDALAKLAEIPGDAGDLASQNEAEPSWPEWAEQCLKIIRRHSGADGFEDHIDGVDLPAELQEHLYELEGEIEQLRRERAAILAEQGNLVARPASYQTTFNAIQAATRLAAGGTAISVSVKDFYQALGVCAPVPRPAADALAKLAEIPAVGSEDWAYEKAKDIRLKWMQTAFMQGSDIALPAGHLSDIAEALRHAEAVGHTMGYEACHKAKQAPKAPAFTAAIPSGETFATIADWCEQTFGPVTPERIAKRAAEEMAELLAEPTKVEEAADVVIVLSRYPDLWEAVERKMAVNRARKWRLMGDGTGYHVKAGALGTDARSAETGTGSVEDEGPACKATPQATPTSPQDHPPSSNPAAVLREPGKGGRS